MTSTPKSHGNARSKTSLQMLMEGIARVQPPSPGRPRCLCGNLLKIRNPHSSKFFRSKPFKGIQRDSKGFKGIQRDSKAFKGIQRFFRKKRLFIFFQTRPLSPSPLRTFAPRHACLAWDSTQSYPRALASSSFQICVS
jgi:hypothetical protein